MPANNAEMGFKWHFTEGAASSAELILQPLRWSLLRWVFVVVGKQRYSENVKKLEEAINAGMLWFVWQWTAK